MSEPETVRLNWSTLRYLTTSAKLLRWRVEHPQPDTDALKLGRAIHCLLLEPEAVAARWTTQGQCAAETKGGGRCASTGSLYHSGEWYCRVRGHAPEGAGPAPEGVEVITAEGMELARICAEAVRAHGPAAALLSKGAAEQEIEWVHAETGIACRGRIDLLRPDGLVDLKSTRRGTLAEIRMDAARMHYYAQLAWYTDGCIAAGRLPADAPLPHLVAVSTVEPYDVAAMQLSRVAYEAGQILYRDLLLRYARCQAADMWPGIAPDIETLDLPPWAGGMNGSEEGSAEEW